MTSASEQSPPQGWCNRQLHDLCYVVGGGTPSRSQPKYWNGDIPWASVKDFSDEAVFLHDTKEHITQEGLESSASTLIQANVPVACTRMAVGRCALTTRPTAINQDLKALLLRDGFDSRFFIRLLKFRGSILDRVSVGSTVRGITTHDLLSLALCYPDKSEQFRIAAVLDTMDEAIVKTEAVIAKLKQVRAGLLHDLLTHGLDEHGQLRDPIAYPEQFKDSSLGRIPREWHVSTLGAELPLQRGFDITVAEQQQGEVPVVSSSGITSYHNKAMVAGPGVVTGRKGKLGDVYYVDRPFWPHDTTLWVTDFHGNSEKFAVLLLGQMRLERFDAATSVPTLNRNFVHPLPVALPSRPEQERLVAVVGAWDECLDRESKWLDKLRHLRAGLATDLLTGRVRVPEGIAVAA